MNPGAGRRTADPRPINDRQYKERSVRKLVEYLLQHGYAQAISPQILTAPATKDFVAILSFLLLKVIPNFVFSGKFEDEAPVVFKWLGYPFLLQKTHLIAVGNPSAWPHALAALSWLVDLLKVSGIFCKHSSSCKNATDCKNAVPAS